MFFCDDTDLKILSLIKSDVVNKSSSVVILRMLHLVIPLFGKEFVNSCLSDCNVSSQTNINLMNKLNISNHDSKSSLKPLEGESQITQLLLLQ